MIVNVIHLPEQNDRMKSFLWQCHEQNIEHKAWKGITGGDVKANISQSHKRIVQNAKDNSYDKVCIAENDLLFTCNKSFDYFIDSIPTDNNWDIFFGGISGGMIDENNIVHNPSGMFLYIVHERFYDVFLSADETKNIDRWLGSVYYKSAEVKPVYKVCNPIAAITSDGFSSHHGVDMQMGRYFKPYELYKV